jgi:hypothetical protein
MHSTTLGAIKLRESFCRFAHEKKLNAKKKARSFPNKKERDIIFDEDDGFFRRRPEGQECRSILNLFNMLAIIILL